ncbi:hypothetical protein DICPUDRAFT_96241 [Dictyostelium purpureum]|uniref:RING-type domain-containing protein n=1 Tax=Dictyostelium purpureum TaxID=5786 RepID=F0Z6F2_DICPU|nr:uncharacterized protein DICPUDRAFT_96241 [Dictyostelium purpureum]EGC40478.1 hypothetical protein DICPUDRAFT_96241 [Dictyostelium purpureum]|eukprot:XP_003283025.1 hypothetical protein DICPUDRAFT_96241 [Dictyostelium purpureum]
MELFSLYEFKIEDIKIESILAVNEQEVKDYLLCPICQNILDDPVQFCSSGHVFCRGCIIPWFEKNEESTCPTCREVVPSERGASPYFLSSNMEIKRKLNKIKVYCPYYYTNSKLECIDEVNGCKEIIMYGDLEEHTSQCQFIFVKCELDSFHIYRAKDNHIKECPSVIKKCKFCSENYQRKSKDLHSLLCSKKILSCPLEKYGCLEEFQRCQKITHLQQYENHYKILTNKIDRLSLEIEKASYYKIIKYKKPGFMNKDLKFDAEKYSTLEIFYISKKDIIYQERISVTEFSWKVNKLANIYWDKANKVVFVLTRRSPKENINEKYLEKIHPQNQ